MHLLVQQITVKCKPPIVSLFYIFINMKPLKRIKFFSCCWKATPTRAFNEFLYEFLRIFEFREIR